MNMQRTPDSHVFLDSCKGQHGYNCADSGYSGFFQSPQDIRQLDSTKSLSSGEYNEMAKENQRLTPVAKEKSKERLRSLAKDCRTTQQPSLLGWTETPKRQSSLHQRLHMCRPLAAVRVEGSRFPCTGTTVGPEGTGSPSIARTNSSIDVSAEHWTSTSFDSLESLTGSFVSDASELEPDVQQMGRKRRLFAQMRTSTRGDGKHISSIPGRSLSLLDADVCLSGCNQSTTECPVCMDVLASRTEEVSQSPIIKDDQSDVLFTPPSTQTPKYVRSVSEDSGFSSVTLDKSQDSSVDYDGSFQELLLAKSRGNCEASNPAETKRRSRLQRQHRLSTLKEGGSQSEDEPLDRKPLHQSQSHPKDDVFGDHASPQSVQSARCDGRTPCDSLTSTKQVHVTPLRASAVKPGSVTPFNASCANPDGTPLRTTPVNLSMTPALQLVHALCQHNAQMFMGQSPSLREHLKSTPALTDTPVMLKTLMPLAGLIGRKMGLGKVDILSELKKRNLRHILAVILGLLTPESIYNCSLVCKSWREIIKRDKSAHVKRRSYLHQVESSEESGASFATDSERKHSLQKRSALKTVQAQASTPSFCTPLSASGTPSQRSALSSGSSKREKFIAVAKTLFNDEYLKACPRCQHPARCQSVRGEGVCSHPDCSFQFCTSCLCAFHGSKECGSQIVGSRKKDTLLPGSAQSKRNVRRL